MSDATTASDRPFHWPVGPTPEARTGPELPAGWYVANPFGRVYEARPGRPAVHTGLDLNLRSGGDSDLDVPVHACGDGIVTASGSYAVWGNIVLVQHTLTDGRRLWSQYAHLHRRTVAVGQAVVRGQQVGTVGKGDSGRFAAHLHFEIRIADLPAPHWPGLRPEPVRRAYVDPATAIGEGLKAIDAALLPIAATAPPPPAPDGPPTPDVATRGRPPTWLPAPALAGTAIARHPRGKGAIAMDPRGLDGGDPAVVARRARALGLSFAVLGLTTPLRDDAGDESRAVDRIAAALAASGVAVWAMATFGAATMPAAVAAIAGWAGTSRLAGWIVAPVGRRAAEVGAAAVAGIGAARPGTPVAVLLPLHAWRHAGDGIADLDAADAILPQVDHAGTVGLATARLARLGRPIVPVLDLDAVLNAAEAGAGAAVPSKRAAGPPIAAAHLDATVARAVDDTLFAARAAGRPGAALAPWETAYSRPVGPAALRAWRAFAWPAADPRGAPVPIPVVPASAAPDLDWRPPHRVGAIEPPPHVHPPITPLEPPV